MTYTATYEPRLMAGEPGYWYRCFVGDRGGSRRLVFEGWSRGRKHHAETEVRHGINAREALRATAGLS